MAHDIFISHASTDKAVADLVCATLEERGVRCWIAPRDIQPGADWGSAIVSAIRESRAMVLVFSDAANASRHIPRELERAIDLQIPILPFRIEDVRPRGSLEYNLAVVHWLDASSPPLEIHARRLADVVTTMLGVGSEAPMAPVTTIDPRVGNFAIETPREENGSAKGARAPYVRAAWVGAALLGIAGIVFAVNAARRNNADPAPIIGSAPTGFPQALPGSGSLPATPSAATPGDAQATASTGSEKAAEVDGQAYFNRGVAHYTQAKYDLAIEDYTQAIARDFSPAYSHNNRGIALAAKKDFTGAAADYDRAIQLDPAFADPFCNRADLTLHLDRNNTGAAIADYTRALALDPKMARAFQNRGSAYYLRQDYENAVADYSSALALKPDDTEVLSLRGSASALRKDTAAALKDFTRHIELKPEDADPLFSRSMVYLMRRDSEKALGDASAYVAKKPNEADGYRARGIAYFQRKLFVLAENDLAHCLALNAADSLALFALGAVKERTGDEAGGKNDIAAALKINPGVGELMKMVGVERK